METIAPTMVASFVVKNRSMRAIWAFFVIAVLHGQEFEVASIKPSPRPTSQRIRVEITGGPGTRDPTLFICQNCSLSMLLMQAYDLKYYQIFGLGSRSGELYDITARLLAGATKEQFRIMLQNLLAERFKLTFHYETKELQSYQLVVAKSGAKIKQSDENVESRESVVNSAAAASTDAVDRDGFPILPPGRDGIRVINGHVRMQGFRVSIEELAARLSNQMDLPVTDSTGLTGKYDFSLGWMVEPRRAVTSPDAGPGTVIPTVSVPDDLGPSISSAIQSQLGLKLVPGRGPVSILVVDHVERVPREN